LFFINRTLVSYTSSAQSDYASDSAIAVSQIAQRVVSPFRATAQHWRFFAIAFLLVSVPVFIQAPLVRLIPLLSLAMTMALFAIGRWLQSQPQRALWGDVLLGFTWTWLAGSLYWGWLRWEPFLHLPVEAIGLPFALWAIVRGQRNLGDFFYLGSLLGTVVTDIYFYLLDLIPYWRQLMAVEEQAAQPIFQAAIAQIQTPWGIAYAGILSGFLFAACLLPLLSQRLHWWTFSGAVLSTIFVDGLFWLAACAR
jgi:Protein of unknown function (DUF3120)